MFFLISAGKKMFFLVSCMISDKVGHMLDNGQYKKSRGRKKNFEYHIMSLNRSYMRICPPPHRGGATIGAGGSCTPTFSNFSVFIVLTPPPTFQWIDTPTFKFVVPPLPPPPTERS